MGEVDLEGVPSFRDLLDHAVQASSAREKGLGEDFEDSGYFVIAAHVHLLHILYV